MFVYLVSTVLEYQQAPTQPSECNADDDAVMLSTAVAGSIPIYAFGKTA